VLWQVEVSLLYCIKQQLEALAVEHAQHQVQSQIALSESDILLLQQPAQIRRCRVGCVELREWWYE
jgi:hypothetical protein